MAKLWRLLMHVYAICGFLWSRGMGETVLGRETEDFDFDGLPGAQHEFKIYVAAGNEECFYQTAVSGGKMHISFEVLKGTDQTIGFSLVSPTLEVIESTEPKVRGGFEHLIPQTGAYAICLDNTFSRMASKLVYIYLITYVEEEWNKYVKEIEEVHLTVSNFGSSIHSVQASISESLRHQAQSRMNIIKDWYLIMGNNDYVQKWSIFQCIVIVLSSVFQVYFVRRLFRVSNVTPTSKPRA